MEEQNVPELRFPEFKESLKMSKLGKRFSLLSGYAFKSEFFSEKGEPLVTPKNFTKSGYGNFIDDNTKFTIEEYDPKYKCMAGDLLVLLTDLTPSCELLGKPLFIKQDQEDVLLNQRIVKFSTRDKKIDLKFLFYFFLTNRYHKRIRRTATGTTVRHSSNRILSNTELLFPEKPEQQKIASFLSAVDKKIEQLTRKKELLEEYKKGVMQKLFPKPGEQHPELRFKDENGEDFSDWEVKRLGEIADRITDKNTENKYSFVLTNSATQGIVSQTDYFDKDIANQNNLDGYYIVEQDDFVYNPRISVHAPVGPIKRNTLETGVMSPLYSVFRFSEDSIDYFESFFETTVWHKHMHSVANYGARHDRMNITVDDFMSLPIPLPNEQERDKITYFLNELKLKIHSANKVLGAMTVFKKGLLQQMFV